jgi:hypothetical protein
LVLFAKKGVDNAKTDHTSLPIALTFVAEDEIDVTKIRLMTLPLNANKPNVGPRSSMRHVAVVNAIDVKQKSCREWAHQPRPAQ